MRKGGTVGMQQQTHFLGAVVLQQTQNMTGQLESRLVVDGQQRLTTLQLLVDAIQEVYEQQGLQTAAERLADMVLNYERYRGGDPDRAFKVWPTAADQEAFRHAMSNELPSDEFKDSNIVRAHEFFKTQIAHWLIKDPEEWETRADALERTVNNLLELVVIDLEMGDDPHVIFETLNARGTPLLESDLVKNMVMHEAVSAGIALDSEAGKNLWRFDDGWWSVKGGGHHGALNFHAGLGADHGDAPAAIVPALNVAPGQRGRLGTPEPPVGQHRHRTAPPPGTGRNLLRSAVCSDVSMPRPRARGFGAVSRMTANTSAVRAEA